MNLSRTVIVCCVIAAASMVIVFWPGKGQFQKIGVVDAIRVFDSFNMKKELEGQAKQRLIAISKQTDSMENLFNMAKATRNEDEIKKLAYAYNNMKNNLENAYRQSNQEINEQVWRRLNPILEEYGKKRGLHLLLGANGMGSVLYNDDYYDMTNDLINYVNKKYEIGN